MRANFDKCFARIMVAEGGFVNHPKDPGGATNMGVTQRVFDEYLAASGQKPYSVASIKESQARTIFNVKYWMRVKADDLQHGWDYAIADCAFNSGTARAVKLAQETLGLEADGIMGPQTVAAIARAPKQKLNEYMDKRLAFLQSLEALWPVFGKGWAARVVHVREGALKDWALTGR